MRSHWAVMTVALLAGGCRATGGTGASFAGAGLFAPLSEAEEAHDGLLRADLGRADSVARSGYAAGLGSALADDVIYLRGGLPLVRGRAAAMAIAAAEAVGAGTTVRWQPVRAEVSDDGRSGYSYGYTIVSAARPGAPGVRVDRYIAYWRRDAAGWRVAAYAETYGAPPPALALPASAQGAVLPNVPMSHTRGGLEAVRAADVAFSTAATLRGTGRAFGEFAADDAQVFSAPGEFISGPDAIMQSFGPPASGNTMVWHPVAGAISTAGDLAFTVGNAVLTGTREDGARRVGYSKYLTVWKKQRDGSWKYVVDGGSARPDS